MSLKIKMKLISERKAFTLLEMMIVMVFIAIFVGCLGWSFAVGLRAWNSGRSRAEIRQDSALAMDRMVRELGQTDCITTAGADEIEFEVDLDEDGTDETIKFDVGNSNLNRTEGGVAVVLAKNVQTFGLSYRDVNNDLMTLPQDVASQGKRDNIRVIIISLTMDKDDETITLSSSIYARNQGL